MSLRSDLAQAANATRSKTCLLCGILRGMPQEDAVALRDTMQLPAEEGGIARTWRVSSTTLEGILSRNGYSVGRTTIQRHRSESHDPQL